MCSLPQRGSSPSSVTAFRKCSPTLVHRSATRLPSFQSATRFSEVALHLSGRPAWSIIARSWAALFASCSSSFLFVPLCSPSFSGPAAARSWAVAAPAAWPPLRIIPQRQLVPRKPKGSDTPSVNRRGRTLHEPPRQPPARSPPSTVNRPPMPTRHPPSRTVSTLPSPISPMPSPPCLESSAATIRCSRRSMPKRGRSRRICSICSPSRPTRNRSPVRPIPRPLWMESSGIMRCHR